MHQLVAGYVLHNIALLAVPVALAALAMALVPPWFRLRAAPSRSSRGPGRAARIPA